MSFAKKPIQTCRFILGQIFLCLEGAVCSIHWHSQFPLSQIHHQSWQSSCSHPQLSPQNNIARGSIIITPVTLSLHYITLLNGCILVLICFLLVSIRLGEIQSIWPFNEIVFFFQLKWGPTLRHHSNGHWISPMYDLSAPYVSFFPNLMLIFPDNLNSFCFWLQEVVLDRELITGKAMTVASRLYVQTVGNFEGHIGHTTGTFMHGDFFEDVAAITYLNQIRFPHLKSFCQHYTLITCHNLYSSRLHTLARVANKGCSVPVGRIEWLGHEGYVWPRAWWCIEHLCSWVKYVIHIWCKGNPLH